MGSQLLVAIAAAGFVAAVGAEVKAESPRASWREGVVDELEEVKDKLIYLDAEVGVIVTTPWQLRPRVTFWGDGATFHQVLQRGGGGSPERWSYMYWDPRQRLDIGVRDGEWFVRCGEREKILREIPKDEVAKRFAKAVYKPPLWERRSFLLARDDRGVYYYVDRLVQSLGGKGYRVYRGFKGKMKLLKMKNIVEDSVGTIFATRKGDLRLISNTRDTTWIRGKKKTQLINVPIVDNGRMIYTELGIHDAKPLGTPCDDI